MKTKSTITVTPQELVDFVANKIGATEQLTPTRLVSRVRKKNNRGFAEREIPLADSELVIEYEANI